MTKKQELKIAAGLMIFWGAFIWAIILFGWVALVFMGAFYLSFMLLINKDVTHSNIEFIKANQELADENLALQNKVEEKDRLIAGLVDDFKYYISEQDNEPTRAGFLELVGKEQKQ